MTITKISMTCLMSSFPHPPAAEETVSSFLNYVLNLFQISLTSQVRWRLLKVKSNPRYLPNWAFPWTRTGDNLSGHAPSPFPTAVGSERRVSRVTSPHSVPNLRVMSQRWKPGFPLKASPIPNSCTLSSWEGGRSTPQISERTSHPARTLHTYTVQNKLYMPKCADLLTLKGASKGDTQLAGSGFILSATGNDKENVTAN